MSFSGPYVVSQNGPHTRSVQNEPNVAGIASSLPAEPYATLSNANAGFGPYMPAQPPPPPGGRAYAAPPSSTIYGPPMPPPPLGTGTPPHAGLPRHVRPAAPPPLVQLIHAPNLPAVPPSGTTAGYAQPPAPPRPDYALPAPSAGPLTAGYAPLPTHPNLTTTVPPLAVSPFPPASTSRPSGPYVSPASNGMPPPLAHSPANVGTGPYTAPAQPPPVGTANAAGAGSINTPVNGAAMRYDDEPPQFHTVHLTSGSNGMKVAPDPSIPRASTKQLQDALLPGVHQASLASAANSLGQGVELPSDL